MKYALNFFVESISTATEIPDYWSPARLRTLLEALEFDGIQYVPEDQLRDYACMALQDLECPEAARMLLDLTLGDRLSAGKKQNISEDMEAERLWEVYADLSCHEPIFNAQVLLSQAFPSAQNPEVNLVQVTLRPRDASSKTSLKEILAKGPLPEALLVRCIAAASSDSAILNRLFDDQIAGAPFPEAEHLVWQIDTQPTNSEGVVSLSLFSPIRWTADLEKGQSVDCDIPA